MKFRVLNQIWTFASIRKRKHALEASTIGRKFNDPLEEPHSSVLASFLAIGCHLGTSRKPLSKKDQRSKTKR